MCVDGQVQVDAWVDERLDVDAKVDSGLLKYVNLSNLFLFFVILKYIYGQVIHFKVLTCCF